MATPAPAPPLRLAVLSCEDSAPYLTSSSTCPTGPVLELLQQTFDGALEACNNRAGEGEGGARFGCVDFDVFSVKGEGSFYPSSFEQYDGVLIPGSLSSSYDTSPWIVKLGETVKKLHEEKVKTIGICFGHQILAHYGGGATCKNEKGGNVGQATFEVTQDGERLCFGFGEGVLGEEGGVGAKLDLLCSHNDIVYTRPPNSTTILSSETVEFQALR